MGPLRHRAKAILHEHLHTHRLRRTVNERCTSYMYSSIHVRLLTDHHARPYHTHLQYMYTCTASNSTPELPVYLERIHASFHPDNTAYAKLHGDMQPHTRCSGTHPGGRVSNRTQTLPEAIRGRATVGCHEMISHPIPSHAWAIRAHIQGSLSHTLTHIHAARRTTLGRNTESDNILAA